MQLPIDAIVPNPTGPAGVRPIALESLAASIRQNGLIQPISAPGGRALRADRRGSGGCALQDGGL